MKVVTCAACGARIRADRERCLRCHEILVAAPESPRVQKLTPGQLQALAATAGVAVLLLGAVAWLNRPAPAHEDAQAQRSAPVAAGEASRVTAPPPATRVAGGNAWVAPPGEALDLSRAGTAAFLTGDLQGAKERFERALEIKPDDAEALNSVGQILDRQGDIAGAIERFEKAIRIAPDRWAYHFNLAHAVGRQGDWKRAVDEYREAIRLFPEDYATQFNLALALHRLGDDAAAIPAFERAIQLAPAEASFHLALGNSLQAVGKLGEARKAFETYIELAPNAPDAGKVRAHIAALNGAARPEAGS
jgi:tetratricopeptide (TPR) repeat protein